MNEEKTSIEKTHILHVAIFCYDLGKPSFGGITIGFIRRTEEKKKTRPFSDKPIVSEKFFLHKSKVWNDYGPGEIPNT